MKCDNSEYILSEEDILEQEMKDRIEIDKNGNIEKGKPKHNIITKNTEGLENTKLISEKHNVDDVIETRDNEH